MKCLPDDLASTTVRFLLDLGEVSAWMDFACAMKGLRFRLVLFVFLLFFGALHTYIKLL